MTTKTSSSDNSFADILDRIEPSQIKETIISELPPFYEEFIDSFGDLLIQYESMSHQENSPAPQIPNLSNDIKQNCGLLFDSLCELRLNSNPFIEREEAKFHNDKLNSLLDAKRKKSTTHFFIEFTDSELKNIQTLINELRDQIAHSTMFSDGHRARLQKRLEALQAEMHKKMSDVDKIWGLVGDAGIALGKFGKDAKPIVDRIKELAQITFKAQGKAEELPPGNEHPLLEKLESTGE